MPCKQGLRRQAFALRVKVPELHIRAPGFHFQLWLPIPASCQFRSWKAVMMARGAGCLPSVWKTSAEFLAPGSSTSSVPGYRGHLGSGPEDRSALSLSVSFCLSNQCIFFFFLSKKCLQRKDPRELSSPLSPHHMRMHREVGRCQPGLAASRTEK